MAGFFDTRVFVYFMPTFSKDEYNRIQLASKTESAVPLRKNKPPEFARALPAHNAMLVCRFRYDRIILQNNFFAADVDMFLVGRLSSAV